MRDGKIRLIKGLKVGKHAQVMAVLSSMDDQFATPMLSYAGSVVMLA